MTTAEERTAAITKDLEFIREQLARRIRTKILTKESISLKDIDTDVCRY